MELTLPENQITLSTTMPATLSLQEPESSSKIVVEHLNLWYGQVQALFDISLRLQPKRVSAFIGPSGCGKSTFIRTLNRMNDLIDNVRITGRVLIDGQDIHDGTVDVVTLRRNIGMIFQKSNPFPKSVFENVAYGQRLLGEKNKGELNDIVERSLKQAALWEEVKDRLNDPALGLSGGQMQRLCIARALAVEPGILLMDEPSSALDPLATAKIEELIFELKQNYTIVIVTHNMQQAARVSDYTAFFYLGKMIEFDETRKIFTNPSKKQTEEYITGRFG